jgi:ABC-type glycerol-3-phosphate transport system permease component
MFFVILTALRSYSDSQTGAALPLHPTLANFEAVWTIGGFNQYVANSLIVVVTSVLLIIIMASLAGYAFAHLDVPFKAAADRAVIMIMVMPASVFLIPPFKVVVDLGLFNSYLGLILVYISLQLPFGIFMMGAFFQSVPRELLQSAQIDGASTLRTLYSVVLPLSRQPLVALATLTFLGLWNELLFALVILQDPGKRTLQVGLTQLQGISVAYNTDAVTAASMVISAVPTFLLFVLFNRQITAGMTAGALK